MAGLDPATQWPRVGGREILFKLNASPARTDVRALGGRVKPGHDGPRERGFRVVGES